MALALDQVKHGLAEYAKGAEVFSTWCEDFAKCIPDSAEQIRSTILEASVATERTGAFTSLTSAAKGFTVPRNKFRSALVEFLTACDTYGEKYDRKVSLALSLSEEELVFGVAERKVRAATNGTGEISSTSQKSGWKCFLSGTKAGDTFPVTQVPQGEGKRDKYRADDTGEEYSSMVALVKANKADATLAHTVADMLRYNKDLGA